MFRPDLQLKSVTELTPTLLAEHDLRSLLLDVDCTLKSYQSETVSDAILAWLDEMRKIGIGMCIVSNGKSKRIERFADSVQLPFVCIAMKPLPFGCQRAVRQMNFDPKTTAMVGDQVFADLMAGKLAGLFTVLIHPIQPEEEPWFTRIKRPFERLFIGKR